MNNKLPENSSPFTRIPAKFRTIRKLNFPRKTITIQNHPTALIILIHQTKIFRKLYLHNIRFGKWNNNPEITIPKKFSILIQFCIKFIYFFGLNFINFQHKRIVLFYHAFLMWEFLDFWPIVWLVFLYFFIGILGLIEVWSKNTPNQSTLSRYIESIIFL